MQTLKVKEVVEAATEAEALAMTASIAGSSAAAAAAVGHTLRWYVLWFGKGYCICQDIHYTDWVVNTVR